MHDAPAGLLSGLQQDLLLTHLTEVITERSQELVAAWKPPELHAYRHLNGSQREVLFFISGLQLNQHLVELWRGKQHMSLLHFSLKKDLLYVAPTSFTPTVMYCYLCVPALTALTLSLNSESS